MEAHRITTALDVKLEADGGLEPQPFKIYRNASYDELQHNVNRKHRIPQETEDTASDLKTNFALNAQENNSASSIKTHSTDRQDSGGNSNSQSELHVVIKVEPEVSIDACASLESDVNMQPQDSIESRVIDASNRLKPSVSMNLDASETDRKSKRVGCLNTEFNCELEPSPNTETHSEVKAEGEASDEEDGKSQDHIFHSVFNLKQGTSVNRQINATHEANLVDGCPTVVKTEPDTQETHHTRFDTSPDGNVGTGFAADVKQEQDLFTAGACPAQHIPHSAVVNTSFDPMAETDDASCSSMVARCETDTVKGHSGFQTSCCSTSHRDPQVSSSCGNETGFQSDLSDGETPVSVRTVSDTEDSNCESVSETCAPSNKRSMSVCTECNAAFPTLSKLKRHFRKHTGEKPYSCKQCGGMFAHAHSLKQHMLIHAGKKIIHAGKKFYQCKQCGSSFQTSAHMQEHARLHTVEMPFVCDHCGASFAQVAGLRQHAKVHKGERPFRCEQCTASFRKPNNLQEHMRIHTGEMPYVCKTCNTGFDQSSSFERHMQKHRNGKVLTCGKCSITFTDSCEFQKHLKTHLEERSLICEHCNASFSHPSTMKMHMKIHGGNRPFQCDQCNASFSYSSSLKKHKRIHVCERPFLCKQCSAAFQDAHALKLHLRRHNGEKHYKCTECDATFVQSGCLKQHMKIHTGEKSFACSECSSAFNHSSALVKHMRTHTGEKPFVCTQCGAAFSQSGSLKKHMNMHAGEKPYVCDQCTASFTQSAGLKKHLRTHTGETPFACEDCTASFNASRYLARHKRVQHAM